MREYFDLEKQVVHLAIDKSVVFKGSEFRFVEVMLRDNNYRNFVSCSKIKFAELVCRDLLMYKTASFKDWKMYFEVDCRVSKHLMANLIEFERTINSRVSHCIAELIESNRLSNFERNTVIQIIQSSQRRGLSLESYQKLKNAYTGEKTWEFVAKMTFGQMKQLLFWLFDNKMEMYLKVVNEYTFLRNVKFAKGRIDEINYLRNSLFHFRPLNVYITHGSQNRGMKLKNQSRKEVVNFIMHINRNQLIQLELEEIFKNSDNYVKIKK